MLIKWPQETQSISSLQSVDSLKHVECWVDLFYMKRLPVQGIRYQSVAKDTFELECDAYVYYLDFGDDNICTHMSKHTKLYALLYLVSFNVNYNSMEWEKNLNLYKNK
jgi:hypothetical protein